jgi:hypothetical protein
MRDEVIEEIRERRQKMLEENFAGSIKRFGEEARLWQSKHAKRVVNSHNQKILDTKARHA